MKKRIIALLLAAALTLGGLVLPASAEASGRLRDFRRAGLTKAAAMGDCYVYPAAWTFDATTVKGETVVLAFKRNKPTPRADDVFFVNIYSGAADDLMESADDPEPVERRTYKMSQFSAPQYLLGMSWTADKRYPVGDYTLVCGVEAANGDSYSQGYYLAELHVTGSRVPMTGMEFYTANDGTFEYTRSVRTDVGETVLVMPRRTPTNSTSREAWTAVSAQPAVAEVEADAGYLRIKGIAAGITAVELRCEKLTVRLPVTVGMVDSFTMRGTKSELCVGQTDKITVVAEPAQKVYCDWTTSDPAVATVRDGVVTAVGPGTAQIGASVYGMTHTLRYTVNYHQLPADTPVSRRTATQPRQAVGHCSVCGSDHAVNVYEPAIFTDTVYDAWYAPHVDDVYDNNLMNGVSSDRFAPNRPLTRAMVATVIYRIAGSPGTEAASPFTDVPAGLWYSDAIAWAAENGIVNGFGNGIFRPDRNITREQLAAILYRYTLSREMRMDEGADLSAFPDSARVQSYARAAMGWAVATGLVNGVAGGGVTELRPRDSATRAQFATIVSRYRAIEWKPSRIKSGESAYVNGKALPTLQRDGVRYVAADQLADALGLEYSLTDGTAVLGGSRFSQGDLTARCDGEDHVQTGAPFLHGGMLYICVDDLPTTMKLSRYTEPVSGEVYLTAGGGDWEIPKGRKVPILAYHAVSNDIYGIKELFMDPAELEKQLVWLLSNGYDPIWFEDLRCIERYDKPVILTFDDGYADNYEELLPLLKKYNVKATCFVVVGALDTSAYFMTGQMVTEMAASGLVSIQSHGMTHHYMDAMDAGTLHDEFGESKRILAYLTKQEPYAVSYPEGRFNALTLQIAAKYFKFGTRSVGTYFSTSDDPLRTSRYNINRSTTLEQFAAMIREANG